MLEYIVKEQKSADKLDGPYKRSTNNFNIFWNYRYFTHLLEDLNSIYSKHGQLFALKARGKVSPYFINLRNLVSVQNKHIKEELLRLYELYTHFIASEYLGFSCRILDKSNLCIIGVANGSIEWPKLLAKRLNAKFVSTHKDKSSSLYIEEKDVDILKSSKATLIVEDVHNNGTSMQELASIFAKLNLKKRPAFLCAVTRGVVEPHQYFKDLSFAMTAIDMPSYNMEELPEQFKNWELIEQVDKRHPKNFI